jgi:hypothetical protein
VVRGGRAPCAKFLRSMQLTSGKFAMIDDGLGFSLLLSGR